MSNTNLNSLFQNYQNQMQYKNYQKDKKCYPSGGLDVNGDGKIDSKDFNQMKATASELLKDSKIFDVNGDNSVDLNDLISIISGVDIDGDGEISQEEKDFLANYKSEIMSAISADVRTNKLKTDEINSLMSDFGKISAEDKKTWQSQITSAKNLMNNNKLTGIDDDGKYYKSGELGTGTYNSVYYVNGEAFSGDKDGVKYVDGKKFTGTCEADGLLYKNGKAFTGTQTVNGEKIYFKDGKEFTGDKTVVEVVGNTTISTKYKYVDGKKLTGLCEDDGLYYKNGRKYTGVGEDGNYYKSGVGASGTYKGILYDNGKPYSGMLDGFKYENGKPFTGTFEGKYYSGGKVANGRIGNNKYENGVLVGRYAMPYGNYIPV